MKLTHHFAPHIRGSATNRTIMGDAVITLAALYMMAFFYYGARALVLGVISAGVCMAADAVCCLLRGRRISVMDYSALVTGLILPLLMPASVSYRVVVVAALFAICVVKQPFGGVGSNIFNPAAGGFAFAVVCWSKELFSYPAPFAMLPLEATPAVTLYSGAAYTMYVGGIPQTDLANLMLGRMPGPMGTTNILVLLACMLYLVLRRTVRIQQPAMLLISVALVAALLPRVDAQPMTSVFYELAAMPTLFFAVFLFSDPVTTPARGSTKAVYSFVAGLLVMTFRYTGGYEFTEPFALLAMNALTPVFDSTAEWVNTKIRRASLETQDVTNQSSFADDEEE